MIPEPQPQNSRNAIGLQLGAIAIVGVVGLVGVIESLWYVVGDTRELYQGDVAFYVTARGVGDAPFTMMVPIPVDLRGRPAPFLQNDRFSEGEIVGAAVVETEHGPALAMSARGNVWWLREGLPPPDVEPAESYSVRHPGKNFDLSMWSQNASDPSGGTLGEAWFYFEGAGPPGSFGIDLSIRYPDSTIHAAGVEIQGQHGWFKVPVTSQLVPPPVF